MSHYRDKDKHEVDVVVENELGEIDGIEVKASATVNGGDFAGPRKLADAAGISQRGSVANSMKEGFRASCSIRVRAVCASVSSTLRPPELRLRS